MRIFRYILGFLFLLASLAAAAFVGYIFFIYEKKAPLLVIAGEIIEVAGTKINVGHAGIAVTVILLVIAINFFPPKKREFVKRKAVKQSKVMPDEMKMPTEKPQQGSQQQEAPQQATSGDFDQAFPPPEAPKGDPGSKDISTYDRLEDPQAMARLVAIDQGEMSREVVTGLFREYYPDLVEMVNRIEEGDQNSLDTAGRHIIGIARNRLKLTDKQMSDNQFSIFQEKVFNGEKEPFLQIYKPENLDAISNEQRAFVGKIVDKRSWEGAQRKIRGERTDWHMLSLENAQRLLS